MASATFFAALEPVTVRGAEVKLKNKIDSIDAMFIVDRDGVELGQITLDKIFDSNEKTWRGQFTGTYSIPKGEERTIGIEVRMKPKDGGGASEQLVQVDTFKISALGEWSQDSYTSAPNDFTFPKHQTAQAVITAVTNSLSETGAPPVGTKQLVAGFTVGGMRAQGSIFRVESFEFTVAQATSVHTSNWKLGTTEGGETMDCSTSGTVVSCSNLPETLGTLSDGPRNFRLFADVTLDPGAQNPFLQVSLGEAGSPEAFGAISWTDGTGHFRWVDLPSPLARSTNWR